ncbi:MAG TPA: calcium-binding protein [Allosphingosinicella sp.]|nr:calcium-binding protein [Allosphingosinicella sp.]
MPVWTNASNGSWGDAARWTGGIPNGAGAVAEFTVAHANSVLIVVSFPDSSLFTVGTLTIATDTDDGWTFRGQTNATSSTLRLLGAGGGPAYINVDTNGSSRESSIASEFGLRLSFASDVVLTTSNSDTTFRISAPITGSGDLYKFGDGTLHLFGANTPWLGDLNLFGGRTEILNGDNIGNATLGFDNSGVLAVLGNVTLANRIMVGGGDATGTIAAAIGSTLTLSGQLVQASDNLSGFQFGSTTDAGTIVLTGSSFVLGKTGFTIAGGTVRIGNANVAANYFSDFSADGLLQIVGTLDTNGFATIVDNLDWDGGSILTSTGVLNLTVNDNYFAANSQTGNIVGTAGADRIVINATINWDFTGLVFNSWTNGVDTITINGNDDANMLVGGSHDETINGNGGDDFLRGGGGTNILRGGTGDDTYSISSGTQILVENANEGTDTVAIFGTGPASFTLADNFENLTFGINVASTGIGNAAANRIVGTFLADILDGKGGADQLQGGGGDDRYFVDNAGDLVTEGVGEGNDRVFASVSYALAAGQSVETLSTTDNAGTGAINLTGNELANTIMGNAGVNTLVGNAGNDVLDGKEGNDSLSGGADNDVLYGRDGNDMLYGGTGANYLSGGLGDDQYVIDSSSDFIEEAAGQGTDRVFASVSYTLTAGVSVETLSTDFNAGTNAINLTGNELADTILGNAGVNVLSGAGGNDILDGREGNDTLYGGANNDVLYGRDGNDTLSGGTGANYLDGGLGDDRFLIDSASDVIAELAGQGNDRIFASLGYTLAAGVSVETLSTIDNAATTAINLTGNELANTLFGNEGANVLNGGAGSDMLDGKSGADTFAFTTALGAGNVDTIINFQSGIDKIALDDAIFTGLAAGALPAGAFVVGTAAADANDRIVYNNATGALLFDADGIGGAAAVQFATLSPAVALVASDFQVI